VYRIISMALALGLAILLAHPAVADSVLFNNDTPNNFMATASRPGTTGTLEIEAADDFFISAQSVINSAAFTGLLTGGATASGVGQVVVEIYRVFPLDSNTGRTPNVPTRTNSPSDVAFGSRDSAASNLTFTASLLSASFTANNSVQAGGISAGTEGDGPVTGQEVQFSVTFTTPFDLPAGHYFFVPQVQVTGGDFLWLSASRPISGAGTTPFPAGITDLQSWTRDANLDPDWLRVGTDIVGGASPPTFNAAFSLTGEAVPLPGSILLLGSGLLGLAGWGRFRKG
jgi:hypothetical protein